MSKSQKTKNKTKKTKTKKTRLSTPSQNVSDHNKRHSQLMNSVVVTPGKSNVSPPKKKTKNNEEDEMDEVIGCVLSPPATKNMKSSSLFSNPKEDVVGDDDKESKLIERMSSLIDYCLIDGEWRVNKLHYLISGLPLKSKQKESIICTKAAAFAAAKVIAQETEEVLNKGCSNTTNVETKTTNKQVTVSMVQVICQETEELLDKGCSNLTSEETEQATEKSPPPKLTKRKKVPIKNLIPLE